MRKKQRQTHPRSTASDIDSECEKTRDRQRMATGTHANVRPSREDRCTECGEAVGDSWLSYRQEPANPETLVQHFGGIVPVGPAEPPVDRPESRIRDFRYPDDLDVFFHTWCAPRVKLPETLKEEISTILAEALVAQYRKKVARWARVQQPVPAEQPPPRCQVQVASIQGRRIFTMAHAEWRRFRSHEGQLVQIELEQTRARSLPERASTIAALAAECSVEKERIEVWRYNEHDQPGPLNVQDYLVLENLMRRINLPKFAERVSLRDIPNLRKHLREHVFLVKARPDKGRWELKTRLFERIVFLAT